MPIANEYISNGTPRAVLTVDQVQRLYNAAYHAYNMLHTTNNLLRAFIAISGKEPTQSPETSRNLKVLKDLEAVLKEFQ